MSPLYPIEAAISNDWCIRAWQHSIALNNIPMMENKSDPSRSVHNVPTWDAPAMATMFPNSKPASNILSSTMSKALTNIAEWTVTDTLSSWMLTPPLVLIKCIHDPQCEETLRKKYATNEVLNPSAHYENTPIQIHWTFHHQKRKTAVLILILFHHQQLQFFRLFYYYYYLLFFIFRLKT